jgi:hypothetical protein
MKKKIYIAGKVTGLPQQEVVDKFAKAQKDIEAMGFEVINPIEVVKDFDMPWNKAMRMCIAGLTECDAIALLPDWSNSKGAIFEYEISKQLEIPDFRTSPHGLHDLKAYRWNS